MGMFYTHWWRERQSEWSGKGGNQGKPQAGMEKKVQVTTGLSVPYEAYLLGTGI